MQSLTDQVVDDVRAVVLSGIDVVDPELDRPAQHCARRIRITRRAKHAGAGELHRSEAHAVDGLVADEGCLVHACFPGLTACHRIDRLDLSIPGRRNPASVMRFANVSGSSRLSVSPMWIALNTAPPPILSLPANNPPGRSTRAASASARSWSSRDGMWCSIVKHTTPEKR